MNSLIYGYFYEGRSLKEKCLYEHITQDTYHLFMKKPQIESTLLQYSSLPPSFPPLPLTTIKQNFAAFMQYIISHSIQMHYFF